MVPLKVDPLVRVPTGKYVWHPPLQVVDFIPKGKNKPVSVIHLSSKDNTTEGALKSIIQKMAEELLSEDAYTHIKLR